MTSYFTKQAVNNGEISSVVVYSFSRFVAFAMKHEKMIKNEKVFFIKNLHIVNIFKAD